MARMSLTLSQEGSSAIRPYQAEGLWEGPDGERSGTMMSLAKVVGLISLTICLAVLLVSRVSKFLSSKTDMAAASLPIIFGGAALADDDWWKTYSQPSSNLAFFFLDSLTLRMCFSTLFLNTRWASLFTQFCIYRGGLFACYLDSCTNQCGISYRWPAAQHNCHNTRFMVLSVCRVRQASPYHRSQALPLELIRKITALSMIHVAACMHFYL